MRRALAIHPGALGDVLQAVPALRALGADARVSFCGQARLATLLAATGVVAEALSFDGFGLEAIFAREPPPPELAHRIAAFDRVVSWFGSRDDDYPARLRSLVQRADRAGPGDERPAATEAPRDSGTATCVVAPPVPETPTPVWRHLLATLQVSSEPLGEELRTVGEPDAPGPSPGRSVTTSCLGTGALAENRAPPAPDGRPRARGARGDDPGAPAGPADGAYPPPGRGYGPAAPAPLGQDPGASAGPGHDHASLCQPLTVPEDWRQAARDALDQLGISTDGALVVVHAGAGSRAKLVATATLAAVVARVTRAASARAAVRRPAAGRGITAGTSTRSQRVHVVLHQGPADAEAVERLVASLDVPPPILRDPSLSLLAGVLSMASAYLGGDSGVSHLAAAVGAPSAIVFPAATRERWRPWSGTARAIAAELGDDAVATEAAATIRAMLDAAAAAAR